MSSLGHKLGDEQFAGLDHKLGNSHARQPDTQTIQVEIFNV